MEAVGSANGGMSMRLGGRVVGENLPALASLSEVSGDGSGNDAFNGESCGLS